jgi:hypothetical protein
LLSEGVRIRTTISPFYPGATAQNSAGALLAGTVPENGTNAQAKAG